MTKSLRFQNETHARWLDEPSTLTTAANCGACTRVNKCCEFQPFVPNFLLGAWLEKGGRLPLTRNAVYQPLGMIATPEYRASSPRAVCAFYSSSTCSLYKFRPGECASYYCDSVSRERAEFSEKLQATEFAIAQMALVDLGFGAREISEQVDIANGAPAASRMGLEEMYLRTWTFSQSLSRVEVQSWA